MNKNAADAPHANHTLTRNGWIRWECRTLEWTQKKKKRKEWNDWKCHRQPTEDPNLNNFCFKIERTIKTIGINYRRSGYGPSEWNGRATKWVRWQIRWIVQLVVAIVIVRVSCFRVICVRLCATNNHNSINNNPNDASIRNEPPRRRPVRFV